MAYIPFVNGKPVITDSGALVVSYSRENLEALRDAIVMGKMASWDMTVTAGTGTAAEPQFLTWADGVYRIRATITWGTTGGEDGNPTVILYQWSGDSGMNYDTIGTITISYDASANVTGSVWS